MPVFARLRWWGWRGTSERRQRRVFRLGARVLLPRQLLPLLARRPRRCRRGRGWWPGARRVFRLAEGRVLPRGFLPLQPRGPQQQQKLVHQLGGVRQGRRRRRPQQRVLRLSEGPLHARPVLPLQPRRRRRASWRWSGRKQHIQWRLLRLAAWFVHAWRRLPVQPRRCGCWRGRGRRQWYVVRTPCGGCVRLPLLCAIPYRTAWVARALMSDALCCVLCLGAQANLARASHRPLPTF